MPEDVRTLAISNFKNNTYEADMETLISVSLSEAKMDVVTPVSAPMFVIVDLSGTDSPEISPVYSSTLPTFPFVDRIERR